MKRATEVWKIEIGEWLIVVESQGARSVIRIVDVKYLEEESVTDGVVQELRRVELDGSIDDFVVDSIDEMLRGPAGLGDLWATAGDT